MPQIDWNIVVSILTALGIFEFARRVLFFWLDNNVIKRNLEIREIAERALIYCNNLKLRNFEEPLSADEVRQLRLDITKIDQDDKELGDSFMALINDPILIKTFYQNSRGPDGNEYLKLMHKYHGELHDKVDKLIPKLNRLRYKPIVDMGKVKIKWRKR